MRQKLYHMSFRERVAHSTLADANDTHDCRIYADFAQVLIAAARPLYAAEPRHAHRQIHRVLQLYPSTLQPEGALADQVYFNRLPAALAA
jgi:hypothetical protein